jgi:hypothetical protein
MDAEWRQTMATQNAYAATPSFDSNVRHTAHLAREPARLEREAPNTLMFGTSVVNCMKVTAASGPEAALYFCLSVRLDLVAPFDSCGQHFTLILAGLVNSARGIVRTCLIYSRTLLMALKPSYALRYRVVNVSWEVPNVPFGIFPFIAECISAPFAIYSSKE